MTTPTPNAVDALLGRLNDCIVGRYPRGTYEVGDMTYSLREDQARPILQGALDAYAREALFEFAKKLHPADCMKLVKFADAHYPAPVAEPGKEETP